MSISISGTIIYLVLLGGALAAATALMFTLRAVKLI
jgi:hypothetical protein